MASQPCQMLNLFMFALIATILIPSPTQASPIDQPALASAPDPLSPLYYPSSSGDLNPELSQYYSDEQDMAPENQYPSPSPAPFATGMDDDYPYDENSSLPPSPSPYVDEGDNNSLPPSPSPYVDVEGDNNDEFDDSPSEAPSPVELIDNPAADMTLSPEVHTPPPVLPFNYNAEDDSGEFSSEDLDEEGDGEGKKKNRAVIGFVMGAVCLVGLGGLVYKRKKNEKREHPMYVQLSKRNEV